MSDLPPSWARCTLRDVGLITTGMTPPTMYRDNYGGTIPFVKPGDLDKDDPISTTPQSLSEQGASRARMVRAGAVLVSCIGNLGKIGFAAKALVTNQQINAVEFFPDLVDDRYGYLYCRTLKRWMESEASATTVTILNKGRFSTAPFVIPPLGEQRRIASKLDAVLAKAQVCRARLHRVPQILKKFREAVLEAAVSGRLTEEWRCNAELAGWATKRAAEVCTVVQSGGTPKAGFVEAPGVPFLKVYNIVDQQVSFDYRPQYVPRNTHENELRKSRTLPGDVLMNIVGPPLGKVAVVPRTYPEWNINQAITLFRPGAEVSTSWIYIVLCSGRNVAEVIHDTRGSVGQVNISLSQCRDFLIPVPPGPEQLEIVRRVDELFALADALQGRYACALSRVEKLTPSVLAKAFRGELVPQDPNDEPAGKMLERIRAARGNGSADLVLRRRNKRASGRGLSIEGGRRSRGSSA